MAAITTAVIAGGAALLTVYGQQQAKQANQRAADINAANAEQNAEYQRQQNEEDARQFRLSFRRDEAKNLVAVGASGVKNEGSPLEVLQDNAAGAERDFQNIKISGLRQVDAYKQQARNIREGASAAGQAADTQSAATLLSGAGSAYSTGSKAGAW